MPQRAERERAPDGVKGPAPPSIGGRGPFTRNAGVAIGGRGPFTPDAGVAIGGKGPFTPDGYAR